MRLIFGRDFGAGFSGLAPESISNLNICESAELGGAVFASFEREKVDIFGLLDGREESGEYSNLKREGDFLIAFAGEICNSNLICEAEGFERDLADASLVLALYQKYGGNCAARLKGEFAFVIFDRAKGEFCGARDTFGKKSLYFALEDGRLVFASTIRPVLAALKTRPNIDFTAFNAYLSFMSAPAPRTIYEGVFSLPAGSRFTLKRGESEPKIEDFAGLADVPLSNLNFEQACEGAAELISRSLRARVSNLSAKPAFLLSGGLDSAFVAASFARDFGGSNLNSFCMGFEEGGRFDERDFARQSAEYLGAAHRDFAFGAEQFFAVARRFYDIFEQPFADSSAFPFYRLASEVAGAGFGVALGGEGGDECFLGYPMSFRLVDFAREPWRKEDYPRISKDYGWLRRKELGLPIYGGCGEVFTSVQKEYLLSSNLKSALSFDPLEPYKSDYVELREASYMDFRIWASEIAATKMARIGEAVGLRVITPLLDEDLAKFCLSLRDDARYHEKTPKAILKKLAASLVADGVIKRKKKGFSSPFMEWLLAAREQKIADEILRINRILPFFDEEFVRILVKKAAHGRFKQHVFTLWQFARWFEREFA